MKGKKRKQLAGGPCPFCEAWFDRGRDVEAHWTRSVSNKRKNDENKCDGVLTAASDGGMTLESYLKAVRKARWSGRRAAHLGVGGASGTSPSCMEAVSNHGSAERLDGQQAAGGQDPDAVTDSSSCPSVSDEETEEWARGAFASGEDAEFTREEDSGYDSFESWQGGESLRPDPGTQSPMDAEPVAGAHGKCACIGAP